MIQINFIPVASRKKSGQGFFGALGLNLPREVLVGAGGVLAGLLLAAHVLLACVMAFNFIRLAAAQVQWQILLPERNSLDAIGNEVKDLRKKVNTISDIAAKSTIGWSRNLNVISDAVPKGVWLKSVMLDSKTMVIKGSAVSKVHDEIATVGAFVSSMKKDKSLMAAFSSLEVNGIQKAKRNTTEIAEFTITARLK